MGRSGPRLGPAMLYWGVLVVLIGAALLLGAAKRRFQLTMPLRSVHWLLLFIGISTIDTIAALPVLLWFFALEARHHVRPLRLLRVDHLERDPPPRPRVLRLVDRAHAPFAEPAEDPVAGIDRGADHGGTRRRKRELAVKLHRRDDVCRCRILW